MGQIHAIPVHLSGRHALRLLDRLCLNSGNSKYLSYHLAFITGREVSSILSTWGMESRIARQLHELGQEALFRPSRQLPVAEVDPAIRADKIFLRAERRLHFPALLYASRRALPADGFAAWLERLRAYLLVRMLDAVQAGFPREDNLYKIAVTVREVCEFTDDHRRQWLQPLQGASMGLSDFENETLLLCRLALKEAGSSQAVQEHSPAAFLEALRRVLEHAPWRAMDMRLPDTPYDPVEEDGSAPFFFDARDSTGGNQASGGGPRIQTQRVKAFQSLATRRKQGDKLRLHQLAESLYLASAWSAVWGHELDALLDRARELARSDSLEDRLGTAIVMVAVGCGVSIHDALSISLIEAKGHRRWIDLTEGMLRELPPRFPRRWRAESLGDEQLEWLRPIGDSWFRALPDSISEPLRATHARSPDARTLAALWIAIGACSPAEHWFRHRFANIPALHRLSAPSTASILARQIGANTNDLALTYLLTSDERSALPAACAYGAYTGAEISAAWSAQTRLAIEIEAPELALDVNAAGSELDLDIRRLRQCIETLQRRVEAAAAGQDWIAHHNLLVALMTVAMLASTGARPVNSPFETLAWFDFERRLVFVEDKVAGPTVGARLCVLTDVASDLLQQVYLPHLNRLAAALETGAPSMAAAIKEVLRGADGAPLPLLFALRQSKHLEWFEMGEATLSMLCGEEWQLPWNFCRHWMSTQLRRRGVAHDIRDALLGHAARQAEPHGDHSARTPLTDLESARGVINVMQREIGLALPARLAGPDLGANVPDLAPDTVPVRFGSRSRAARRLETLKAATDLARREIDALLSNQTVDQLTPTELDAVARRMLFRGDLPHPMASVRYEVWEDFLQEQWRSHGRHAKPTHRYQVPKAPVAHFSPDVIRAHAELEAMTRRFENAVSSRTGRTEGPLTAVLLAAVDMVLYSRLAHLPPLMSLLRNDQKSFRLVRHLGRHWYEWAFGGEWVDGKPAFRCEITERAATWIRVALGSDRTLSATPPVPLWLQAVLSEIAEEGEGDAARRLKPLLLLRSQQNNLALPGFLTAYLSGRRVSFALPHADWIRLTRAGAPAAKPGAGDDAREEAGAGESEEALRYFRTHRRLGSVPRASALGRCRALFEQITRILSRTPASKDREKSKEAKEHSSAAPGASRQATNAEMASAIARAVSTSGFGHGDAPFMLAHFIVHVLSRRPQHGQRDRLRATTALRYWHSLARPFNDAIPDQCLVDADEEELTLWYAEIVQVAQAGDERRPGTEGPFNDAASRTLAQLSEFHEFVRDTYGLPDPDWGEISVEARTPVGRPGLVLLNEYLCALKHVLPDSAALEDSARQRQAFVLLCGYRFGLRTSEALGLRRRDWIEAGDTTLVAVESNRWRPLKTPASRRVVPLRETLTPLEQSLVDAVKRNWQSEHEADESRPLLSGVTREGFSHLKAAAGAALLDILKAVTGNRLTTVHQLRHSFAMRLTADLLGLSMEASAGQDLLLAFRQRQLFVGHGDLDRRVLWAVARALGHTSVSTTLLSYVNCLHLWLPSPATPVSTSCSPGEPLASGAPGGVGRHAALAKVIDLDTLEVDLDYLKVSTTMSAVRAPNETVERPDFIGGLEYLRMVLIGKSEAGLARDCQISESLARRIGAGLAQASDRLAPSATRYAGYRVLGGTSPGRLKTHIARVVSRWKQGLGGQVTTDDWLDTVGSSRQLLGFDRAHFEAMASFMNWLGFDAQDVVLIRPKAAGALLLQDVDDAGLSHLLVTAGAVPIAGGGVAKAFQLDVARAGLREVVHPHRAALIPRPGGQLADSHELMSLWVLWNLCRPV